MDGYADLLKSLIDHGLVYWAVGLAAFWIVCANGKALLEGTSSFIAEQKRVDGEERRKDQEFLEAAERRRARQAKASTASAQKALTAPKDEPLLLSAPDAKPSRAKVSSKRRG